MTVLQIAILAAIITFAGLWSKNFIIALVSSAAWLFTAAYAISNPPWGLVAGSTQHQMLLLTFAGMVIGVPLYIVFSARDKGEYTPTEEMGFKLSRFLSRGDIGRRPRQHRQTSEEYRDEAHSAIMRGRNKIRRRR